MFAACQGQQGTLRVEVAEPPGAHLLERIAHVRVTLSTPRTVVEADRGGAGLDLSFEVGADGAVGFLELEATDANGSVVAVGASPSFSVAALTARVVLYVAPPLGLSPALTQLPSPVTELGVGPLGYGAVLVGGRSADGRPSDALAIYNAYDHTLVDGAPLPGPRASPTVAVGASGYIYVLGGTAADGAPSASAWRFDPQVAPAGAYAPIQTVGAVARAGQRAVAVEAGKFLITGSPILELDEARQAIEVVNSRPSLAAVGEVVIAPDGGRTAVFASDGSAGANLVRYRRGAFDELSVAGPPRSGQATALDASGRVLLLGGGPAPEGLDARVLRVNPDSGAVEELDAVLTTPRRRAAVASTPRYILVAGGVDAAGAVIPTAELLDATSLAPRGQIPLVVARAGATAIALPNGQILVAGGEDHEGRPTQVLELFTPDLTLSP